MPAKKAPDRGVMEPSERQVYFPQIDALKGLAIISVLLLHTIPRNWLINIYAHYHIWQAVPVFFILLGITTAIYYQRHALNRQWKVGEIYSWAYFLNRSERFLLAFVIIFAISLCYGIFQGGFYFGPLYIMGRLPVIGPGNYFASILIQFALVSPLLYFCYIRYPRITVLSMIALEIVFQVVVTYVPLFAETKYLYSGCILRYFTAIALGLYISTGLLKENSAGLLARRNWFILAIVPLSLWYLWLARTSQQPFPLFWSQSSFQNVIAHFYPALLVLLTMRITPSLFQCLPLRILMLVGKASYHIFLVQILYFGFGLSLTPLVTEENVLVWGPLAILMNVATNLLAGTLFWFLLQRLIKRLSA
ncbi:acyltransferase family protein [Chloroflexota bacterium]